MPRRHLTRWLAAAILLGATVARPAATPGPAPLWPTELLHHLDYVDLRVAAAHFGLKAGWARADFALALTDAGRVRASFEVNQKDFYFDGLRVFLGVPVLAHHDSLWVSKLDLIKIVAPLLDPAAHAALLPAAPPHTIVVDPGHGGVDPGTRNPRIGLDEKTATLDVAKRLARILETRGWRVLLVRDKDTELSRDKKTDLLMRDEFANRNKADLYLSIHFNHATASVTGIETYAMTPQFMLSAGDDHGDEMTRVAFPGNRMDYANLLFGASLHRALTTSLKVPDRGFKHAREAVLRMLDCPGALVECGYLSNDAEAARVALPDYRQRIAEGLATGIQEYANALTLLHPPAPAPAPAPGLLAPPTRPPASPAPTEAAHPPKGS